VFVWTTDERVIYNLGTQRHWKSIASPEAIAIGAGKMVDHARGYGVGSIAMPRIGAGLGGLYWPDVRDILDGAIPDDIEVTVYYLPTS
jgi:O-acetyl-ADP-ribose deacetylase (regulator of RNase III)